jgi:hypothetical protein
MLKEDENTMNPFAVVKVLSIVSGVALALIDPARLMPDFCGVYHHIFRRLCWVVTGMGLSQLVAHCGMARVYFCEIYKPDVDDTIKQRIHMIKDKLGGRQLLCGLIMATAMLLPLSAALDWLPLKWWLTPSAFADFGTSKGFLLLVHLLAGASVPVAGMVCNGITSTCIEEANAADE